MAWISILDQLPADGNEVAIRGLPSLSARYGYRLGLAPLVWWESIDGPDAIVVGVAEWDTRENVPGLPT